MLFNKKNIIHILITIIVLFSMYVDFFQNFDYSTEDIFYQSKRLRNKDIVLVAIDDESTKYLGKWPWARDVHAELLNKLKEGGASVIGIDILFTEPSYEEEDYELELAFKENENIVLAQYANFEEETIDNKFVVTDMNIPIDRFANNTHLGHINVVTDEDGILRHAILKYKDNNDNEILSFPYMIYSIYEKNMGRNPISIDEIPKDILNRTIIRYVDGASLINYNGKNISSNSLEFVSYYQVINGEVEPKFFENKIVLIGPVLTGTHDYYYSPLSKNAQMAGIEVHANFIQQLIEKDFYNIVNKKPQYFGIIFLSVLLIYLYSYFSKKNINSFFVLFLILTILYAIYFILKEYNFVFKVFYFLLLVLLTYIANIAISYIEEKLKKDQIRNIFSKYVAPQVVDELLEGNNKSLELGGIRKDITVLFVDIRGFTALSESTSPEEVVLILNDYLTLCAKSIFDNGGTLDKYIGDAAMAIYNAPFDLENHQLAAVKTAIDMRDGAKKLNEELMKKLGKTVSFGIGIHTGTAIVGNIGADFRMDYTAIGDTVNTASRIESNTTKGQILISKEVYDYVKDDILADDLGIIHVKNKVNGIQIYQVNGLKEEELC